MNIPHNKVFASLGNELRLQCLYLAARHGEVCVCEVVDALGIAQPSVSKAFKVLKEAGFVADRRSANWTYYRVNEDMPAWMAEIVRAAVRDISQSGDYGAIDGNFRRSATRTQSAC